MKAKSETKLYGKRRSFCDLSREFLNSEMHQYFITELLLFGILFAVSVWPMLSLADAMAQSIR
jgi:hypothetical protein